jgi:hypothetical protein
MSAKSDLDSAVAEYRRTADFAALLPRVQRIAHDHSPAELIDAVAPYIALHEVAGPIYEVIVEREPANARALVALANAYWLTGRGPDIVAGLAERAKAADPANRAAWHLWALAESSPRQRTGRWRAVVERFPDDDLARANLADNAASLAGAEDDPVALKTAIATYEELLVRATHDDQREALQRALTALRDWKR